MSLQSIRKNYVSFLETLKDLGVKINESQKETFDNFMSDIEKTMEKQRDQAIITTKNMVEDKLENEYRKVVESIIKHQAENAEMAGKIQNKVSQINESNKIVNAVDMFLTEHLDKVLPNKTIVDYQRMQKLERIQESLKDLLTVEESEIESKKNEKIGKIEKENSSLKEKIKLYESSIQKNGETFEKMSKQIKEYKARQFVEENTKNLPIEESRRMHEKLKGMKYDDIKKNFSTILESVKSELKSEKTINEDSCEKNLEEAITEILEKRNNANSETSDKDAEGQDVNSYMNQDFEWEDDLEEPGSNSISESQMLYWIDTLNRITPTK